MLEIPRKVARWKRGDCCRHRYEIGAWPAALRNLLTPLNQHLRPLGRRLAQRISAQRHLLARPTRIARQDRSGVVSERSPRVAELGRPEVGIDVASPFFRLNKTAPLSDFKKFPLRPFADTVTNAGRFVSRREHDR